MQICKGAKTPIHTDMTNFTPYSTDLTTPVIIDPVQALIDRVDAAPLSNETLDEVALKIADLADEIDALTAKRDRLRKALTERFLTDDLKKVETSRVKVTVTAGARRVKLKVKPQDLPERFQLLTSNDKVIKEAVDEGEDLSQYLTLIDPTPFVRITPKLSRG